MALNGINPVPAQNMSNGPSSTFHGGQFWTVLGTTFENLHERDHIVTADVLDAWYPPSPQVLTALSQNQEWQCRTSPPVDAEGVREAIARARDIPIDSIAVGAGSSALIFSALQLLLNKESSALALDPMYGEYTHVLEKVIGCRVATCQLNAESEFRVDVERLALAANKQAADIVFVVNPNSPTGQVLQRAELLRLRELLPSKTLLWVDETYVDFVSEACSLEQEASQLPNTIVCKSMSKAYALSGLRAGYCSTNPPLAAKLRLITPPWALSLPTQIAAVAALSGEDYYRGQWEKTHQLRAQFVQRLRQLDLGVVLPGRANFVLLTLHGHLPPSAFFCEAAKAHGIYLRDASSMGATMGDRNIRISVRSDVDNERVLSALEAVTNSALATLP